MDNESFQIIYKRLTQTQKKVVDLLLTGGDDHHIGESLGMAKATVRRHISNICQAFADATNLPINRTTLASYSRFSRQLNFFPKEKNKIIGDIPSVINFFGRTDELAQLTQWIINENTRMINILGLGGIGKTTITVQLVKQISENFDFVIWKSLNIPSKPISLDELLTNWLEIFDNHIQAPYNLANKLDRFIKYLQNKRCLLILDNFESIMQCGSLGSYCQEYEEYGVLLKQILQSEHQSCLIITSREKPNTPYQEQQFIRDYKLAGLNVSEVQNLFKLIDNFTADELEWQEIQRYYAGNPLLLKHLASFIQEIYNCNISQFINEYLQNDLLQEIQEVIEVQLNRLSNFEKEIVYWLAINREPLTIDELKYQTVSSESQRKIAENIKILKQRSFIEETSNGYTLQPVVNKCVTENFIKLTINEIINKDLRLLNNHCLVKATQREFIRDSQRDIFVHSILQELLEYFDYNQAKLENHLREIIQQLKNEYTTQQNLRPRRYATANIIEFFRYLKTDLTADEFSNLTIRQADFRNLKLLNVNLSNSYFEDCLFSSLLGSVLWVVFSPSGSLLAAGDINGNINIWRVIEDKFENTYLEQYCTIQAEESWLWTIRFSPVSLASKEGIEKYIASASDEHHIQIWDIETQQNIRCLEGHQDSIKSLSFNEDAILASASDDKTIKIWNIETGECLLTLTEHEARVRSVSFNPENNQILASAGDDETIRVWDINTGKCLKILRGHTGDIRTVCFSPDGQHIASGGNDKTVRIWNINNNESRILQQHYNWVRSVDFSPNGKLLLSASEDQTIKLWDVNSAECLTTFTGHYSWVQSVRFSPNGQKFASSSADRSVRLWDINLGCLTTIQGYTNCLFTVAFSPDGKTLASGYEDRKIRLWNLDTGEYEILKGHTDWVRSVTFSHSGKFLASSSGDRKVRLWNLATGDCQVFEGHQSWIRLVRFSPDDKYLASCSDDRTIKIWDLQTEKCIQTLEGHQGWVRSIAFSFDGQLLASAGGDGTVKLWNLSDIFKVECIQTLQGHDDWVWSVAFAPNGKLLASTSGDATVKIWCCESAGDYSILKTLTRHTKSVRTVAFSCDGKKIATGGIDRILWLWDTQTWEPIASYEHSDWIRSLAFNNQGCLASTSQDGIIKLWDISNNTLKPNEIYPELHLPKLYEGMNLQGAKGLTQIQAKNLTALGAIWK